MERNGGCTKSVSKQAHQHPPQLNPTHVTHVSIHARQHPRMSQTSAHTSVNLPTCTSPPARLQPPTCTSPVHMCQPRPPAPASPICSGPAHLHQPRPPEPAPTVTTCTGPAQPASPLRAQIPPNLATLRTALAGASVRSTPCPSGNTPPTL